MADLNLDDSNLASAALLLSDAAAVSRGGQSMPMLHADTYTGVGGTISNFLTGIITATEAVSDAAGAAAATAAGLMAASTEIETEISLALGPGFVS